MLAKLDAEKQFTLELPDGPSHTRRRRRWGSPAQAKPGWAASRGKAGVVVLSTDLTPVLIAEGLARESTERLASLIGGGTLAVLGLSRWSLGGLGLAAIGAGLAYRGATGHCGTYELLGVSTAEPAMAVRSQSRSNSSEASQSIVRSKSCIACGVISRTCRSS